MNVTTQGIGHKVMSVLMALVLAIGLAPMVPAGERLGCDRRGDVQGGYADVDHRG